MEVEKYFFRYAFPCAHILVKMGSLKKEKFKELEKKFNSGKSPSKEELEKIFPAAFRRIKMLAKKMKKDYWDLEVMKEYWLKEHNKIIDKNDGNYKPTSADFKDFCKVHKTKVIDKQDNLLTIKYGSKTRKVVNHLISTLEIGNTIIVHHNQAIEKI